MTLLLAYYFRSLADSGAARPQRFKKYLAVAGHPVEVVTTPGAGELIPKVACKIAALIQRWLLPYNEALEWVPYAYRNASRLIRAGRVHSVLSTSPPLATHFAACLLKLRFGVRWIADFRDPVSDNPFRNRRFARFYDTGVERFLFRYADAIVANTDVVGDVWRRRYPQWADKIHVIWNGYDPDDQVAACHIPPRTQKVLAHVGTLYGGRRPSLLLESLQRLVDAKRLAPARLLLKLIGPVEGEAVSRTEPPFSTLAELGCVECNGVGVPAQAAREAAANADALILLDLNEKDLSLQVPGKLFEYIRIGRPILAFTSKGSPVERILGRSGVPHCLISPRDPRDYIDSQVERFLALNNEPVPPSNWFLNEFNARLQTGALLKLLG